MPNVPLRPCPDRRGVTRGLTGKGDRNPALTCPKSVTGMRGHGEEVAVSCCHQGNVRCPVPPHEQPGQSCLPVTPVAGPGQQGVAGQSQPLSLQRSQGKSARDTGRPVHQKDLRQVNSKRAQASAEGTLNAGPGTAKLLGANTARELADIITHSYIFTDLAPPAKETRK